ncbi:hypothetical protein [Haloarchaeobius sp. DFWS5]|uniref:hypothetical protein n=1 Tax=Haloarchaeobius sp. DFWS5 TaxID=3446114 RepID=UPI003EB7E3CB
MVTVLGRETVEDIEVWKRALHESADRRKEHGSMEASTGYRVFTVSDDPNELVFLFEWDSIENARAYFDSSETAVIVEEAGVLEREISFLDEAETKSPERPTA